MAESEEELKGLLMKVKEKSEKSGIKLNNQKTKIMAHDPITLRMFHSLLWSIVKSFGIVNEADVFV